MHTKNNWHNLELEEIFAYFQSTTKGLTDDEVIQKRNQFGSNALPTSKRTTIFQIFIRQFLNPLIFVLVAAAIAAIAIGESGDSLFIFIVIFFNAFKSFSRNLVVKTILLIPVKSEFQLPVILNKED